MLLLNLSCLFYQKYWEILLIFFFSVFSCIFFVKCETVLEIDSNNVKAYYRRGQSLYELGDPNAALADFTKVIRLFFVLLKIDYFENNPKIVENFRYFYYYHYFLHFYL